MSGVFNIQQAAQSLGNIAANASGSAAPSSGLSGRGLSGSDLVPGGLVPGGVLGAEAPAYNAPFAGVMRDAIAKTQALDTQASNAVTGLLSGQGVDIHTAMIATEKSDLAFEMMLSLRNKAIGAYQQLMGMQF